LHENKYIRRIGMSNDNKSDKDIILQEMAKTAARLKNNGLDITGLKFGIDKKIREGTQEDLDKIEEGKEVWRKDDEFIKVFPKEIAEIAPLLSGAEIVIVMLLFNCMSYSDGLLRKGGRPDGKPITMDYVEKLTGYTKKTVIKAMGNLVRKRVYFYGRTGRKETDPYQFYANPYIFFKGKYINPTLISMFKDYNKD
jgi:hypothetical protein